MLRQALDAAQEALYHVPAGTFPADVSAEPPTMAQQQADALGLLAASALHHGIEPGAPGERHQVVVHVVRYWANGGPTTLVESRAAVSLASPGGSRGWISDGATA